jgi:general secretion pathway protein G
LNWILERGYTFIELIITVAIVAILASVTMPMMEVTIKREKEKELRAVLRELREAIDAYKEASDAGRIKKSIEESGYPPNLDMLVKGVIDEKDPQKRRIVFLRRIPLDPTLKSTEYANPQWGLRSYESSLENPNAGADVYDVYSLSSELSINGIPYAQW